MQCAGSAARVAWSLLGAWWLAAAFTPALALAGFADTIGQRTLPCSTCHGKEGRAAPDGYYPRIAGKPAGYLYNQLRNFRDGRRHYGPMAHMVDPLGDAYLQEIAGYFSALELPYPPPQPMQIPRAGQLRAESLVRRGDAVRQLPACVSCHGGALTGVAPHVPGLLGLPRDYLNSQLGAWKTGQRRAQAPDCMAQVLRRLSDDEISDITGWLAAQALPADPRAVAVAPVRAPSRSAMACGSAPELGGAVP
jgi:cytochrome c553